MSKINVFFKPSLCLSLFVFLASCGENESLSTTEKVAEEITSPDTLVISAVDYQEKLYGFWLAQCIANWTGLITEMDKIGFTLDNGLGGGFYTRDNWGRTDGPNIWQAEHMDALADSIDFFVVDPGGIWGADDDTDIEYVYQYLTAQSESVLLTPEQIREGWLTHIYSDENTPFRGSDGQPENYLWVSNQTAHDLMREGMVPPATSDPANNPNYEMIDAQLTTEIFGLFAPGRPDLALRLAHLPIRTTAREDAAWIAEFYVVMHALASRVNPEASPEEQVRWLADQARHYLPDSSYAAGMYDYVHALHQQGEPWEAARDSLHQRYQIDHADGYDIASREPACYGCFAAGINFGASIVSLLYGAGDLRETIKIGALCGWDSDNPTATWGGLIGFLRGKSGVEEAFGRTFADRFNIHRTRGGFPNKGIDNFANMASTGAHIAARTIREFAAGRVDTTAGRWYISVEEAMNLSPK